MRLGLGQLHRTATVSGGTIASAVTALDGGLQTLKQLQDPYVISDTAPPAKRDTRQADVVRSLPCAPRSAAAADPHRVTALP